MLDENVLSDLRSLDTPTVCNALEVVAPERRATGFTTTPLVCARPSLPPIVGYARTVRIRAEKPDERPADEVAPIRIGYYEYVAEGGPVPSVMVIEDIDEQPGFGAWWGEVNSNVHKGLGSEGCVTNGSVRDIDDLAGGFQILAGCVGPSHAHVHVFDYAEPVTVHGMEVASGDLVHADRHGAVVIPLDVAAEVRAAADAIGRRERVIIEAAQQPGFGLDDLWTAFRL